MEAARFTGVAQPTLHNILHGRYKPRADTIARLAHVYGVSLDFISGRSERSDDDTYEAGAHAAIRTIRRELVQLEESIEAGEFRAHGAAPADHSIRPAPRDADVNLRGVETVPASKFPPAVRDAALPAKKRKATKKRRA